MNYNGGDRGQMSTYAHLFEQCQTDFLSFGGNWQIQDNGVPVILHESVSVLGDNLIQAVKQLQNTKVITYVKDLDGIDPFVYCPMPYDFNGITPLSINNPWDRINQAYYCANLSKSSEQKLYGSIFQSIPWINTYEFRNRIAEQKEVFVGSPGPTLEDKLFDMSKFRYAIACENAICRGWVTEKLWDCFMAKVVPIFVGGELPQEIEDSIIRVNQPENIEAILSTMTEERYLELLSNGQSMLNNSDIIDEFRFDNLENIILSFLPSQ